MRLQHRTVIHTCIKKNMDIFCIINNSTDNSGELTTIRTHSPDYQKQLEHSSKAAASAYDQVTISAIFTDFIYFFY